MIFEGSLRTLSDSSRPIASLLRTFIYIQQMDWGSGSNDHGEGKEGVDGGEIRNDPNGRRPVVASEPRFDRWVHPDVTDGMAVSQKSKPVRAREARSAGAEERASTWRRPPWHVQFQPFFHVGPQMPASTQKRDVKSPDFHATPAGHPSHAEAASW